jgi:hypothetical protein
MNRLKDNDRDPFRPVTQRVNWSSAPSGKQISSRRLLAALAKLVVAIALLEQTRQKFYAT